MNNQLRIERLFKQLVTLIKNGRFTREEIMLMEQFLSSALGVVRDMIDRGPKV